MVPLGRSCTILFSVFISLLAPSSLRKRMAYLSMALHPPNFTLCIPIPSETCLCVRTTSQTYCLLAQRTPLSSCFPSLGKLLSPDTRFPHFVNGRCLYQPGLLLGPHQPYSTLDLLDQTISPAQTLPPPQPHSCPSPFNLDAAGASTRSSKAQPAF